MKKLLLQIAAFGMVSLSHFSTANAVAPYSDSCLDKIQQKTTKGDTFEACIKKTEGVNHEAGNSESYQGCINELNDYVKTIIDLKKCELGTTVPNR